MTKSSRARRKRARDQKYGFKPATAAQKNRLDADNSAAIELSKKDKRYLLAFGVLSLIITAIYWSMGGRNIFVFPALMCISVGARKYWSGPIRRFADQ